MIDDARVQASLEFDNFAITNFAKNVGWFIEGEYFAGKNERHFVHAYAHLGLVHLDGRFGYKRSIKLGMRYMEKGASLGSGECAIEMSKLYKSDTWWWGKPKKNELTTEINEWRRKAIELWEWEAYNLKDTFAAYSLYHQFRPLNLNTPDSFEDKEIAEKWKAMTIELSKANGDGYRTFL